MKIGIISDVHGNFEALKNVLKKLDEMDISRIFCLGDVVGYYSQVNECCEELIARDIPCVMGNHDWYMAGGGFCPRSKSVNDCLVYQREVITESNLNWLRTFPVHRFIGNMHLLHGGWADPIDEYLREPTEEYFSRIRSKCEFFFSGHTHVQGLFQFKDKTYCNPGSVGQPRDNDPRAAFAVVDNGITLHRIEYNMQIVFDLMEQAGFDDYYYGALKTGAPNLRKL
jgi:putative phosphoesterase